MIDFDFNSDCCGCAACANSCVHGAIRMKYNDEGFLMPTVDTVRCVDCGLCDRVCPHLNTPIDQSHFSLQSFKTKSAYLYYSNDLARKNSASGGFVYDVYRKVLSDGGAVCGCVWNDRMEAIHIVTESENDLPRLQSSKYVQSNMRDCFKQIRQMLHNGRTVAFCGTPCQTAALNRFVSQAERAHLIAICLICHGVPSPGVWNRFKTTLSLVHHGTLTDCNMRDKSYRGYSTSYVRYTFKSLLDTESRNSDAQTSQSLRFIGRPTYLADPFIFLFTNNLFLRHSCSHCAYKAEQNGADVIVGDYYKSTPGADNLGCSCLLSMTEQGERMIRSLPGTLIQSDYITVGRVNSMLWQSSTENSRRAEFFTRYKHNDKPEMSLFTDFLPWKFHVKKILNKVGLFGISRRLLTLK